MPKTEMEGTQMQEAMQDGDEQTVKHGGAHTEDRHDKRTDRQIDRQPDGKEVIFLCFADTHRSSVRADTEKVKQQTQSEAEYNTQSDIERQ